MRKNFTYLITVLFLFTFNFLSGQTIVWPSDSLSRRVAQFNSGLNGWTSTGGTLDNDGNFFRDTKVKWVWNSNGKRLVKNSTGTTDSAFTPTAGNGVILFDAQHVKDSILQDPSLRVWGEITSPAINIEGKNNISVFHNTYLRNNRNRFWIAWSEDSGRTWVDTIRINSYRKFAYTLGGVTANGNEFETGTFWRSYTNEVTKTKLPGSKGTKNFMIKFLFTGNDYYWVVDDVFLVQYENELQVNKDFFALAPNLSTPKNQVEAIPLQADISNQGNNTQTNTKLFMTVRNLNTSTTVFTDSLALGNVAQDQLIENEKTLLKNMFTPSSSTNAVYRGVYRIRGDSTDQFRGNDTASFLIQTTDSLFRKVEDAVYGTAPGGGLFPNNALNSYRVGNYFFVPKGKSSTATKISVNVSNSDDLKGKTLTALLYKWKQPLNDSGFARAKDLTIVAAGEVRIPTSATGFDDIDIPLTNERNDLPGKLAYLEDTTAYLAVIEFTAPATPDKPEGTMFISVDNRFDFAAMEYATAQAGKPRKASCWGGFPTYEYDDGVFLQSGDFAFNLFGTTTIPVVSLTVLPFRVATNEVLSDANKMEVFPNPTQNSITLDFDLEKSTDVMVRIVNINGQPVLDKQFGTTKKERTELNVSHLSNGTYLMQILTADGVKTKQFTIAK